MTAQERLLDALRNYGSHIDDKNSGKVKAQCPAHDDDNPSLSVGLRRDGQGAVVKCHAGCDTREVLQALNLTMADLFDEPKVRRIYDSRRDYRYPGGRVVHRKPGKDFPQSGNKADRSLYGSEHVTDTTTTVYVVEGEKDVEAVQAAGGVAVCSAMGAGKAHLADWSPLTGKRVVVIADKDDAGRMHAAKIVELVRDAAASVRIAEAAVGKDFADQFAADKALDELMDHQPEVSVDGAELLDDLEAWFARFIAVTFEGDLGLLALWTVHTHLVRELYTTPRLQLDSTLPESGKTTVLDHFSRLCHRPVQVANLSSPALLPRLLETGVRTILLDEVDRSLRPDGANVPELIGIINSGYRFGATRPVLVPVKGGGWEASEMPTHAPVAMAGNAPNLPDDTRSRCVRILLMPDLDGSIEDSDWELIEDDATKLHDRIVRLADQVRDQVAGMQVELPKQCIGRAKEKWRPLKRVAVAAGGRWPEVADGLIEHSLAEVAAEREAGLRNLPPGMVLLTDLHKVWPDHDDLVPTRELVADLVRHNPDYWGSNSPYGKALTETRFGKLLAQAAKITSSRPGGAGPRGYLRPQLTSAWHRLGIARMQPGGLGEPGEPGGNNRDNRHIRLHRVESDPQPNPADVKKFCPGCGTYFAVNGEHRADCTTQRQVAR